jgi:ParB-like chromosome segregation protein Spo0J
MQIPSIWAVEREASDLDAYALSLVENMQRVDLSHTEKVAALDQLAELSNEAGLRRTADRLHMSAGWLSVQLAMRRDSLIYPALEQGQISFGQAAALLRAPAEMRQRLLQRTIRDRAGVATIQTWVRDARRRERGTAATEAIDTLRELLAQLNTIVRPTSTRERKLLRTIAGRIQDLLSEEQTQARPAARQVQRSRVAARTTRNGQRRG